MIKMKKTNTQWYPSKPDGNYYRLMDGVLMACAMDANGARDPEVVEVDYDLFASENSTIQNDGKTMTTFEYLKTILEELKRKE
jgi:hypothetical protein